MRTIAPAKINLTLEVLGKRDDGYHEIRSVMQTISLWDDVEVWPAAESSLEVIGDYMPDENDLALRATALAIRDTHGQVGVRLTKRIPVGAGLGGGSSDAAATLRCLDRLWEARLPHDKLRDVAARTGSDVAFFLAGGTALAEGRGEGITPLPDVPELWLVLLAPPMTLPEKTRRMYASLRENDFTDGVRTEALVHVIRGGEGLTDSMLSNAFERAAYDEFAELGRYRDSLLRAGAHAVHLCGAGPALFALTNGEEEARAIVQRLGGTDGTAYAVRTLGAKEAIAVRE